METLILITDTIVIMVVVYFSLRNEKRPEGAPEIGFFRIRSAAPGKAAEKGPAKVVEPMRAHRSRRL